MQFSSRSTHVFLKHERQHLRGGRGEGARLTRCCGGARARCDGSGGAPCLCAAVCAVLGRDATAAHPVAALRPVRAGHPLALLPKLVRCQLLALPSLWRLLLLGAASSCLGRRRRLRQRVVGKPGERGDHHCTDDDDDRKAAASRLALLAWPRPCHLCSGLALAVALELLELRVRERLAAVLRSRTILRGRAVLRGPVLLLAGALCLCGRHMYVSTPLALPQVGLRRAGPGTRGPKRVPPRTNPRVNRWAATSSGTEPRSGNRTPLREPNPAVSQGSITRERFLVHCKHRTAADPKNASCQ